MLMLIYTPDFTSVEHFLSISKKKKSLDPEYYSLSTTPLLYVPLMDKFFLIRQTVSIN